MRVLATGFGPFGGFEDNPSAWIAERLGVSACILEVSFQAVDEFVTSVDADSFDVLLMLGVAGDAKKMRIERVARNAIGDYPDVRGERRGDSPIDPQSPQHLSSTLWAPDSADLDDRLEDSIDAGDYLCNYGLYRALQKFEGKQVGFLHVAPDEVMPKEAQLEVAKRLVATITSTGG